MADFDTHYTAALNLRLLGLMLQHPTASAAPYRCEALLDAAIPNASQLLLYSFVSVSVCVFVRVCVSVCAGVCSRRASASQLLLYSFVSVSFCLSLCACA